jgi:proliferating cell nuclear antigen
MSSSEFTRICRELYQLAETVIIETNKTFIKFSVSSEVVGGSIKIDSNNDSCEKDEMTSINVEEPVNLAFALRYLNMFTKASSLSQQVKFFIYIFIGFSIFIFRISSNG